MRWRFGRFQLDRERSCPRTLRIISFWPQNSLKCPHLNPFWRGQGHGLTSFFLPTYLISSRVALRHVACYMVQVKISPTSPVAAQAMRKRFSEPTPFAGLTHEPPCALCEQEPERALQRRRNGPIPCLQPMSPRTIDASMHFSPYADCDYRRWLGLNNLRANGGGRQRTGNFSVSLVALSQNSGFA